MHERYEAVVVGGGIVGSATAYHLARNGVETLLVDRRDEGRATDAGAGILSAATSSRGEPWFGFAAEAVAYYDDLVAALETDQDGPRGYAKRDLLRVAVDDEEIEEFDETLTEVRRREAAAGPPAGGSIAELSTEDARAAFPPLADVRRAFRYDDAARVDGRTFEGALRRAGETHGLETRDASAERLVVENDSIEAVVVDGDRIETGRVVVAGGAWSAAFGDQLGISIPIEPQRGQIVHLDVDADTTDWPIVSPFRGHYLVSWDDGRVAVGATRETGTGFAPHTTVAGLREVLDEATRVAPGLAEASVQEVRVGLRPVSADGLPALGAVPGIEGAFVATGHGPSGLQLGPYSGKLVADAVRGDESDALEPFGVDRF
ncbi:FAD-binding oxidoreductase [Halococcus sp. IIIV-5B]|uniref:NAD(P)/FAD-dependent oxidoreductase n=1 Tax=Halococcus sp. IIIV-5B TaxID=2321230 RepID=UPI000E7339D0|nr:FAD-dependent oxidoreductase [Halococcus sp. IIIV-5B]RJT03312.1 FAD-dependent oxidoreductase [Halococcus sp. IIIV-5B]